MTVMQSSQIQPLKHVIKTDFKRLWFTYNKIVCKIMFEFTIEIEICGIFMIMFN